VEQPAGLCLITVGEMVMVATAAMIMVMMVTNAAAVQLVLS
jgi:hypothetical protein